jgi:hypothetical protein
VNALAAPVIRPSASHEAPLPDGELSLTDLLDLFEPEEAGDAGPAAGDRVGLRARLNGWVARAAAWGSGPQGAWRAW